MQTLLYFCHKCEVAAYNKVYIFVMLQEQESVIIEMSVMRKVVEKEVSMISHTDGHKINIKYIVALVPVMQLDRENDLQCNLCSNREDAHV